jgi:hypothetical protein
MKNAVLVLLLAGIAFACGPKKPETPPAAPNKLAEADAFIEKKQFSAALSVLTLEGQKTDIVRDEIHARYKAVIAAVKADSASVTYTSDLKDAHLAYAVWLEYYGLDPKNPMSMKEVMPASLSHYRRVLQLDPENEKAKTEIAQIEGIYKSMNREVPSAVAE